MGSSLGDAAGNCDVVLERTASFLQASLRSSIGDAAGPVAVAQQGASGEAKLNLASITS